jgi:hypothetical protein
MAVTRRNSTTSGGGLASTLSATIPSTTAGSTLVITIPQFNFSNGATQGTITSITPATGTASFSEVASARYWNNSNASGVSAGGQVWIAQNVSSGIVSISVTSSVGDLDHFTVWELSPCVLDTPMTGAYTIAALTGGSVSCSDAGAILLVDMVVSGGFTGVASPWTVGGTVVNGCPSAYRFPGAAGSYGPTYTTSNDTFWQIGLSLKQGWIVTQGIGATPTQVTLANGAGNTTTLNITPSIAGSMLFFVAAVGENSSINTWTASDSVDGAWTVVAVQSGGGTGLQDTVLLGYRDNASSTAARTVTLSRSTNTASTFISWSLGEAFHDGFAFATDGSVTWGSGATSQGNGTPNANPFTTTLVGPTPTVSGDLIFALYSVFDTLANVNGFPHPVAGDAGWSAIQTLWTLANSGAGNDGYMFVQNYNSTSQLTTGFTLTASVTPTWTYPVGLVFAFKGGGGAAVPVFGTLGDFDPDLNVKAWF